MYVNLKTAAVDRPLVTVVTPSYNMREFLEHTIQSVLSQDYPNIDYIVMDGGSSDGTVELLEKYSGRLRYWSGPDRGAAAAINEGFRRSSGEICGWLSADDTYLPGAVSKAVERLVVSNDIDVVYGDGDWVDRAGRFIGKYPTLDYNADRFGKECFICQPATFFRRAAFDRAGGLDPALRSAFDYDLWVRLSRQARFERVPVTLATSRMHDTNKSLQHRSQMFKESISILQRYFGYVPFQWVFGYTCYLVDGRDQFTRPIAPSFLKYCCSLPVGCWYNRSHPIRFVREWLRIARSNVIRLLGLAQVRQT